MLIKILVNFEKVCAITIVPYGSFKKAKGIQGYYRYSVKGEDFIQAIAGKAECLLALKKPKLAIKYLLGALQRYPYDICLVARFQEAQELYQKLESK